MATSVLDNCERGAADYAPPPIELAETEVPMYMQLVEDTDGWLGKWLAVRVAKEEQLMLVLSVMAPLRTIDIAPTEPLRPVALPPVDAYEKAIDDSSFFTGPLAEVEESPGWVRRIVNRTSELASTLTRSIRTRGRKLATAIASWSTTIRA